MLLLSSVHTGTEDSREAHTLRVECCAVCALCALAVQASPMNERLEAQLANLRHWVYVEAKDRLALMPFEPWTVKSKTKVRGVFKDSTLLPGFKGVFYSDATVVPPPRIVLRLSFPSTLAPSCGRSCTKNSTRNTTVRPRYASTRSTTSLTVRRRPRWA